MFSRKAGETDRKTMGASKQFSDQRQLYDILMQVPAMIAVCRGPELIYELANPQYLQSTGKTKQIIGKPILKVFPELAGQNVYDMLRKVRITGEPYYGTETLVKLDIHNDGQLQDRYYSFVYQPYKSDDDKGDGVLTHAMDVTEQVLMKQKSAEDEERYRNLFESIDEGFCMIEVIFDANDQAVDYLFLETNRVFAQQTGLRDTVGKTARELVPGLEGHWFDTYGDVAKSGKATRFVDGSEAMGRWFDVHASRVGGPGSRRVAVLFTDITKRRQANEKLQESERRFRMMADNIPVMVWITAADDKCTYLNKQWYDYTGQTAETGLGFGWLNAVHPDDAEAAGLVYKHASERRVPLGLEYRLRSHDGRYRWFLDAGLPKFDDYGNFEGYIGSVTDIDDVKRTLSRQKQLEAIAVTLRQQHEELLALNAAKDEFISLASHQLRTPATAVKQYLSMVLEGYAGDVTEDQKHMLDLAHVNNERQITIVNDLLKVAQVDAGKVKLVKQRIDVAKLMREVLEDQQTKFNNRNQTVAYTCNGVAYVRSMTVYVVADANRLRMVLENIVDNAGKYTPQGKSVTVRILPKVSNGTVDIKVEDTGVGIAKTDIDKLFHKFIRVDNPLTAEVDGTGLGLYWAKKIIDLHGGDIIVDSRLGHGSTFTISLPTNKP